MCNFAYSARFFSAEKVHADPCGVNLSKILIKHQWLIPKLKENSMPNAIEVSLSGCWFCVFFLQCLAIIATTKSPIYPPWLQSCHSGIHCRQFNCSSQNSIPSGVLPRNCSKAAMCSGHPWRECLYSMFQPEHCSLPRM